MTLQRVRITTTHIARGLFAENKNSPLQHA